MFTVAGDNCLSPRPSSVPHPACSQHTVAAASPSEPRRDAPHPWQRGHDYIVHTHTWICMASHPSKPRTLPVCRQQGKSQHLVQPQTKLPLPLRRPERGRTLCQHAHLPPIRSQPTFHPLCSLGPPLTLHFHERNQRMKWPDLGVGRGAGGEEGEERAVGVEELKPPVPGSTALIAKPCARG